MYTPELSNIMTSVYMFQLTHTEMVSNGINFKTLFLKPPYCCKNQEDFFRTYKTDSVSSYEDYQTVITKVSEFEQALISFVNMDTFSFTWKYLSQNEKMNIIYFDENSYRILRKKLTSQEAFPIDWEEELEFIQLDWNSSFQDALNLPNDFLFSPSNILQFFKQKKQLLNLGYPSESIEKFSSVFSNNKDELTRTLFHIVCQNQNSQDILKKLKSLNAQYSPSLSYKLHFIDSEEKKINHANSMRLKT